MTEPDNRREFTRAPVHVDAMLITRGGNQHRGVVIDLSLSGVFLRCEETLPVGTDCELTLTLGDADSPITARVRGTVVRSGSDGIS